MFEQMDRLVDGWMMLDGCIDVWQMDGGRDDK